MKRKELEKKIAANRKEAYKLAKEIDELTDQLNESKCEYCSALLKADEEVTKESINEDRQAKEPQLVPIKIDTDERKAFIYGYMFGWLEVMAQIDLLADTRKKYAEERSEEHVKKAKLDEWDYFEVLNNYLGDIYTAITEPEKADRASIELAQTSLRLVERALSDVDNQDYPF